MLEMVIDSIRVSLMNYQRVVILKEKDADRYLPIWIGPNEADAIAVKLQGINVPRPLTHDLLRSAIGGLGASIKHVVVNNLEEDTFYAKIILTSGDNHDTEIDARPSDAIALAVRGDVPIYVEDNVLEKASIILDKDSGEAMLADGTTSGDKTVKEADLKRMSAFTDFINQLDLEDFGKQQKR